jgi:Zn-finger nucleic acid-binding protein
VPYVRCPGCALDTYSAAGHSTIDECPRCGAPLDRGVRWERVAAPRVRRRRIALRALDPEVAQAKVDDTPAVAPTAPDAPD